MVSWTEKQGREALATISSLKRALGIPNHPTKTDTFIGDDFHIYTPDEESAQLIGELFFRYGNGRRAAYYDAHPEKFTVRDTVKVKAIDEGGYDTSISIPFAPHFSEMLQKMIAKHIAPDSKLQR